MRDTFFREEISEKLKYLEISLNYLRSRRNITLEDLRSNYELRSAIERNFQIAIEAAIDVSEMIISEEGAEVPETYREAFLKVGRNGGNSEGLLHPISSDGWFQEHPSPSVQ